MNILFRNVRVVQPESAWHGQSIDIFIQDGIISGIGKALPDAGAEVIDMNGACVSVGWFDMSVRSGEPGFEYKEDLQSLCSAALDGGFTGVLLMPDGAPCTDHKGAVELVYRRTMHSPLRVHSAGALSKEMKGEELSEMYDLHLAGSIAFTDSARPVKNAKLLLLAMQYAQSFRRPILCTSLDAYLAKGASVNEGPEAVNLGMKGIPAFAEDVSVNRDLQIAAYAGTPLHFMNVTSPAAVQQIAAAREKGAGVSVSLGVHYLAFSDEQLQTFDSNYKVFPPLRSEDMRLELLRQVKEGQIQILTSDHTPEDRERKIIEFEKAAYGIIGLQTFFGVVCQTLGTENLERTLHTFTVAPRRLLGLEIPRIEKDAEAELTFFDPEAVWTFTREKNRSRSENSPFIGTEFKGKPLGVYTRKQWVRSGL